MSDRSLIYKIRRTEDITTNCVRLKTDLQGDDMSTQARINSSRSNGARSRGPVSAEGQAKSSQNSLRHGLRAAAGRVLAGESREELEALHLRWVNKLRPRDEAEEELVADLVDARWMLRRTKLAQFEHLKARIDQAGQSEERRVEVLMNKLLWDPRGPHCMYATSSVASGGPGTSSQASPDDPNDPSELVRQLTSSCKGCEALIANWQTIADRVR